MTNKFNKMVVSRKKIYQSRHELDMYRFALLKKQLINAYRKIPYYNSVFTEAGVNPYEIQSIADLQLFPLTNKDIIRSNSHLLINSQVLMNKKFKSHTSGSTGQPMWTYYDLNSWLRKKYFVKARARLECGLRINDKIAHFESSSLDSKENESFFFRNLKSRFRVFSIFESNESVIQKILSFSPDALYGFPSYLFQLGQFMKKNNYKLNQVKRIFTSSEYLQENIREYLSKTFKAEVFDIYGSTEFKEVAWECENHEGYHINEDEVIVEILKDGKPAGPGIIGNIVITDLRNTVMPLIRYRMNDKGMLLNDKCTCGRTFSLMKPYAGRSSEYVILPNNEILSPYLFTTSIEKIDGLLQYQIIQTSENMLTANVVCNRENFNRIAEKIKEILSRITYNQMEIEIEHRMSIDVEKNGKFKVVKNLILEQKEIKV